MPPAYSAALLTAQRKPVTVGADDDIDVTLKSMSQHKVRRLPVIDGHDLVGIISQADIARNLPDDKIARRLQLVRRQRQRHVVHLHGRASIIGILGLTPSPVSWLGGQ